MTQKRSQKKIAETEDRKSTKGRRTHLNDSQHLVDYKKNVAGIWSMTMTKYVLGGLAVATILPIAIKTFRRFPKLGSFISDNVNSVEDKVAGMGTRIKNNVEKLRSTGEQMIDGDIH